MMPNSNKQIFDLFYFAACEKSVKANKRMGTKETGTQRGVYEIFTIW